MKQTICVLLLFTGILTLKSQDKRMFEIGASAGYVVQNTYDRGNADVIINNTSVSGGLYFSLSRKFSHNISVNGAYFKNISFKNTALGHGFYAEFNYSFLNNSPIHIFNNFSMKYGGFCSFNANYNYLNYLTNNEISFLISFPIIGPAIHLDLSLPCIFPKSENSISYKLQASLCSVSIADSYNGTEQPYYPEFNLFNKHLYLNSDISYKLNSGKLNYTLGYKWIFEYSEVNKNLCISGTHQIYFLFSYLNKHEK